MRSHHRLMCAVCALAVLSALVGCARKPQASKPRPKSKPTQSVASKLKKQPKPTTGAKDSAKQPAQPVDIGQLFGQQPAQPAAPLPWQQPAPAAGKPGTAPPTTAAGARPAPAPAAVAPGVKPTAKQLLNAIQNLYRMAQSLRVDYKSSLAAKQDGKSVGQPRSGSGTVMFKRPNKFVVRDSGVEIYSDGKTFWNYVVPAKRYVKGPMSKEILRQVVLSKQGVGVLGLVLGVDYSQAIASSKLLPDSKVGGKDTYVLFLTLKSPPEVKATQTLWIGKNDLVIRKNRVVAEMRPRQAKGASGKIPRLVVTDQSSTVTAFAPNPKLPDSAFAFKPPAGAKLAEQPKKIELMNKPAPDFAFKWTDGSQKKLSDFQGKPVVLYFWALPQSAEHLPVLQSLYTKHQNDAQVVAVNLNSDAAKVDEYVQKKGFSLPVVHADQEIARVAAEKYGLSMLPAVILIDDQGIIRYGALGNSTSKVLEEKLAALKPSNSAGS